MTDPDPETAQALKESLDAADKIAAGVTLEDTERALAAIFAAAGVDRPTAIAKDWRELWELAQRQAAGYPQGSIEAGIERLRAMNVADPDGDEAIDARVREAEQALADAYGDLYGTSDEQIKRELAEIKRKAAEEMKQFAAYLDEVEADLSDVTAEEHEAKLRSVVHSAGYDPERFPHLWKRT